ncbi:UNVERIFIED_CONTAM: Retrovirus-related Pol polyprotein from transposon TNT 1-94 [Sesamum radiatum]|uniref:Retrovirus-related Pol polyprotein from transposon TNT 1-94 n=1 Tax=Sesamum radiatum TaxID=300843 RepID=A0AAW2PH11_SESRA
MFWGEALLTVTYLLNRLPSSVLSWKTAFEMLHNKAPTYEHLRVFGCLCFATIVKPNKDKFGKRALKCLFLGYCSNQKGFKLYDLDNEQLVVSWDVVFHEKTFPLQSTSSTPKHDAPLPLISITNDSIIPSSFPDASSPTLTPPSAPSPPETEPIHISPTPSVAASPQLLSPSPRPIRHSHRTIHKPLQLSDYDCNHTFSPAHQHFVAQLSILQEPRSYAQARRKFEWEKAMADEIEGFENNNTWYLTPLPEGKQAIGSKWFYKLKLSPDGSVSRYKARLVAKGYTQVEGVDYTEIFFPVARSVTVRLFLGIASAYSWPVHQLDVNNAFLHGRLDEELMAYADADWGACVDSHRSIKGYCVFLGSSLISWKTKKQNTVSRSSAEAEYRTMAAAVCELQWITYLLQDFQIVVSTLIPFWYDNQAAIHITANPVFHERINTWISTAILFVTNTRKASSNPPMFPANFR